MDGRRESDGPWGSKRGQISLIDGPCQKLYRVYPSWKKTGRDCESRPNAPPTWGRFDISNISRPTNQIKQKFWLVKFAPLRTSGGTSSRLVESLRRVSVAMRQGNRIIGKFLDKHKQMFTMN